MKTVFFGSFLHYSAYVLEALVKSLDIKVVGVVTTPPALVGRKQIITKTPVHKMANNLKIPVYTPNNLNRQAPTMEQMDYFVVAGYGKILPKSWLDYPKYGSLNLHFSLLPKYRGANPAEWAIMGNETETGITLIKMDEGLDTGAIIKQANISIESHDTRESLYEKLYRLGAEKLPTWLNEPLIVSKEQEKKSPTPYAAKLNKLDGFIPWQTLQKSMKGAKITQSDIPSGKLKQAFSCQTSLGADFIFRLSRALFGYPTMWTMVPTIKGDKRMKIIESSVANGHWQMNLVQIEGQKLSKWNQVKNQILGG